MTSRICYGLELNPLYVDVIVRRCQVFFTGRATMHQAPGQSFDECADRQDRNQSGAAHGAKTIRRD
jgi:hypothetical protein